MLLITFFCSIIPESPKWLIENNRKEEVINFFKKIAYFNKKELSEPVINQYLKHVRTASKFSKKLHARLENFDFKTLCLSQTEHNLQNVENKRPTVSLTRIFQPDLRRTTLVVYIAW